MKYIEDLLKEIACELKEYPNIDTADGMFNIFKVLGVQTKEVIICRFIGALLDPKGSHNMGTIALEYFFKKVLNENAPDNLEKARVELEEVIDGDRRVDIVIHIGNNVFPIEVKVWAGDQDAQLSDYYAYYKKNQLIKNIYYLTPYGWSPSKASIKKLNGDVVKCISFETHINLWLDSIMSNNCIDESVKSIIQQFKEIIFDMSAKNEQIKSIMSVLNLDTEDFQINDSLKAAVAILNSKDDLVKKIIVNYLKKSVIVPEGYVLVEVDTEDETVDKYSYAKVMNENTTVAWLCVKTNLYIVAQKVKSTTEDDLWKEVSDNYVWQYLHPRKNGKRFPLKQLECMFEYDNQIKIKEFIDDIIY